MQRCYRVGEERFGLGLEYAPKVHLVDWNKVEFIADWERKEILLGFRFHPAIDQWLYSVYFGVCHEYGHLLWHPDNLILREAWASLFGLQVLADIRRQSLPTGPKPNRLVLTKDYVLTLGLIKLMPYMPGETGQIGRVLWECQQLLNQDKWSEMRLFLFLALQAEDLPEEERLIHYIQLLSKTLGCTESVAEKWLASTENI